MIELDKQMSIDILKAYSIENDVVNLQYLINGQALELEIPRIKIVTRAYLDNGDSYIVKIVKEEEHTEGIIESQSILSERFRSNMIQVPKRYKNYNNAYCSLRNIYGYDCCVTIEEDFGPHELNVVNQHYVQELADLMAKMHTVSEMTNCHISISTIWDIFNDKSDIMSGFRHFLSLEKQYSLNRQYSQRYNHIVNCYSERKASLSKIWNQLPRFATQGDFSINNIILKEDCSIRGVIDFNIAGDEVLVNDLITEGIFICYIMDLDNGISDANRKELFDTFIYRYMQTRRLSDLELSCMNDIYRIVFPFLWTRIEFLETLLEQKKDNEVDRFLDETWMLLNEPYF